MKITKEWLEDKSACSVGIIWFDEHFPEGGKVEDICNLLFKEEQFNWANWLVPRILSKEDNVKYAIFAARRVLPIYEQDYPDDQRPRFAIEAAEDSLTNHATAACDAASEAARDAACDAASEAASAAAWAASAAAWAAARDAAWAAAWAASNTGNDAAWAAARAASNTSAWVSRAAWAAIAAARNEIMGAIVKYGLTLVSQKG